MTRRLLVALLFAVAVAAGVSGFALLNDPWPDGIVTMQLQLGTSGRLSDGSGSWGESAEAALSNWNQFTQRVQFRVVRDSTAPVGDGNGVNNVTFATDVYGMAFGTNVLAVTTNWSRRGTRTEADVIFNSGAGPWDSYSGPLRRGTMDFHRVALHEFGHVLGLAHPDEAGQSVSAIMNSHISDLDHLTSDDIAGVQALYGGTASAPGGGSGTIAFPPRNESLDFRAQLEVKYRVGLGRSGISTFVDTEGDVVWTQEYLRYRVNQCTQQQAIDRVMTEIDGAAGAPVCGPSPTGQVLFPPRNDSLDFRTQLEAKYRDGLKRTATTTSVDNEGDVVWTQEYLRYRVNGCGHGVAVADVFTEIDGHSAPPLCR
jgi:hypothetical protein